MPLLPSTSESDRIRRLQARINFSSYTIAKQVAQDTNQIPPRFLGGSAAAQEQSLYIPFKLGPAFLTGEELATILQANSTIGPQESVPPPTVYASADWATYVKGVSNAQLRAIRIDSTGNIYAIGYYNSASVVSIYNADGNGQSVSSVTLPITSGSDSFLIKYSSTGQVQWAVNFKTGGTDTSNAIAIDSSNNIYIGGAYSTGGINPYVQDVSGSVQINSSIRLPTTTNRQIFLIKYNSSGLAQWAANIDGTESNEAYALVTDSSNNVYMVGQVKSSAKVVNITNGASTGIPANSSVTFASLATYAAFLVKWDTTGSVQWGTYLNGLGGDDNTWAVGVDSSNNLYLTGVYASTGSAQIFNASGNTQTLSSVTLPSTSGTASVFLLKYNSSGVAQWATYFEGPSSGYGLVVDSNSNIIIIGDYVASSTVVLKNASGTGQTDSALRLSSVTGTQMFLVKYNSSGQVQWATCMKTDTSSEGIELTVDSSNNLYITGGYKSSVDVTLYQTTDASGGDQQVPSDITLPASAVGTAYLVSYDSDGICRWATFLDTDSNYDVGYGVAIYGSTLFWGGYYRAPTTSVTIQNAAGTSQVATSITIPSSGSVNASFLVGFTL